MAPRDHNGERGDVPTIYGLMPWREAQAWLMLDELQAVSMFTALDEYIQAWDRKVARNAEKWDELFDFTVKTLKENMND